MGNLGLNVNCCSSQPAERDFSLEGHHSFSQEQYTSVKRLYELHGQGHVFEHYEELSAEEQQNLMAEAEQVNPAQINQLYNDLVVNAHASSNNTEDN